MNFTDLEMALLLLIAVLVWRLRVTTEEAQKWRELMATYAEALVSIGKGVGRVRVRADGTYYFERIKDENRDQAGQS